MALRLDVTGSADGSHSCATLGQRFSGIEVSFCMTRDNGFCHFILIYTHGGVLSTIGRGGDPMTLILVF